MSKFNASLIVKNINIILKNTMFSLYSLNGANIYEYKTSCNVFNT